LEAVGSPFEVGPEPGVVVGRIVSGVDDGPGDVVSCGSGDGAGT
jgi:hypothetical protein